MGVKFVGSFDYSLGAAESLSTTPFVGPWIDVLESEIHEFESVVASLVTGDAVVTLETDDGQAAGHIADTQTHTGNGTKTTPRVSMGGMPGGRRARVRAVMTAGTGTLTSADLRETRSGLG